MYCPPVINNTNRSFTVDLLGELVVHERIERREDVYIIKNDYEPGRGDPVLSSYYLRPDSDRLQQVYHFPLKLSEVHLEPGRSADWSPFYQQLDQRLVADLLSLGLDLLGSYALVKSHPGMRRYLSKPLILLLATYYRSRFETLSIAATEDFKRWLPRLFGCRDKLSKGQIRTLVRINFRRQESAIKAAKLIVSDFQMLQRFLPKTGELEGESICFLMQLLSKQPELREARWLCATGTTSAERIHEIEKCYQDTRLMMRHAGITNTRRVLLKQTSTLDELFRLHDRYATQKYHRYLKADTAFNTMGMQDIPPLTLVRTVAELRLIAREFRNCAEIYCQSCITGQYVHWLYRYGDESALLQLDFSGLGKPTVSQFFGPRNTMVSARAKRHCVRVVETITRTTTGESS